MVELKVERTYNSLCDTRFKNMSEKQKEESKHGHQAG